MSRSTNRALMLDTATNEPATPSSRMAPAQARMHSQGPRALTRMTRSNSSGAASASSPECPTPAVTVTQVGTPQRRRVTLHGVVDGVGVGDVAGDVVGPGDVPRHEARGLRPVGVGQGGADPRAAPDDQGERFGPVAHAPPFAPSGSERFRLTRLFGMREYVRS